MGTYNVNKLIFELNNAFINGLPSKILIFYISSIAYGTSLLNVIIYREITKI